MIAMPLQLVRNGIPVAEGSWVVEAAMELQQGDTVILQSPAIPDTAATHNFLNQLRHNNLLVFFDGFQIE
jgi:hypothetical protein